MSQGLLSKIIDFTHESVVAANVAKLYALLYPHITKDFRGKEDCKIAMDIVDQHFHMHTDSTIISSVQLPTQPPTPKSAVQDTIALAQIGTDPQFPGLAAKISASIVVKPFRVT